MIGKLYLSKAGDCILPQSEGDSQLITGLHCRSTYDPAWSPKEPVGTFHTFSLWLTLKIRRSLWFLSGRNLSTLLAFPPPEPSEQLAPKSSSSGCLCPTGPYKTKRQFYLDTKIVSAVIPFGSAQRKNIKIPSSVFIPGRARLCI